MGKSFASHAEMLDAVAAIMGAALVVLDDPSPVRKLRGPGLDELEDAYQLARGLLNPAQWDDPTFVMLAELADAAYPTIHRRKLGLDHSAADLELAAAVEHGQDFLVRIGQTVN